VISAAGRYFSDPARYASDMSWQTSLTRSASPPWVSTKMA
jgi:hypothetical protein